MATLGFDPTVGKQKKSPWDITGTIPAVPPVTTTGALSAGTLPGGGQGTGLTTPTTTSVNVGQPQTWQTSGTLSGQGTSGGYGATVPTNQQANQGQGFGYAGHGGSATARMRAGTPYGQQGTDTPGAAPGGYTPQRPAQAYTTQRPPSSAQGTVLPSGVNSAYVPGMSYVNGKWQEVPNGADVVYEGSTGTYYYHGQPLSQEQFAALRDYGPQGLGGTGRESNFLDPDDIEGNLTQLGFGQMPTAFQAPQIGGGAGAMMPTAGRINTAGTTVAAPGMITAPRVTAEQGGFQDFDALERSIYKSNFDPVNRELERQRGMADERLAAQLAQAGIAESGTGVGQRAELSDEYYRKQIAASEDAASRAAQQRYGMEYEQSMKNAEMRQQANLANAGFDMQAQVTNAQNLLTTNVTNAQIAAQLGTAQAQMDTQASIAGAELSQQRDVAQAQMYLSTMGLNFQQAQAAQRNYLDLLGLQQQDLARMDQHELDVLSLWYNTCLKEFAIMVQAGQQSTGKTDQSSSTDEFNVRL